MNTTSKDNPYKYPEHGTLRPIMCLMEMASLVHFHFLLCAQWIAIHMKRKSEQFDYYLTRVLTSPTSDPGEGILAIL